MLSLGLPCVRSVRSKNARARGHEGTRTRGHEDSCALPSSLPSPALTTWSTLRRVLAVLGSHAQPGGCVRCAAGQYDDDSNSTTKCARCGVGRQSATNGTACLLCAAGKYDHDLNPATSCKQCSLGSATAGGTAACVACATGKADVDPVQGAACHNCAAGTYAKAGASACQARSLGPAIRIALPGGARGRGEGGAGGQRNDPHCFKTSHTTHVILCSS